MICFDDYDGFNFVIWTVNMKTMKKLTIDNIIIHRNKSIKNHAATSQRQKSQKKKQMKNKFKSISMWKKTTLLEKKLKYEKRIGEFKLKIAKKNYP